MQGIGAIQRIARAADDLDGACLFAVQLDELVDVAEARGAYRNAVFQRQESAAGATAAEHWRSNGGLVLLSAATHHPCAGHAVHDLMDVLRDVSGMAEHGLLPPL